MVDGPGEPLRNGSGELESPDEPEAQVRDGHQVDMAADVEQMDQTLTLDAVPSLSDPPPKEDAKSASTSPAVPKSDPPPVEDAAVATPGPILEPVAPPWAVPTPAVPTPAISTPAQAAATRPAAPESELSGAADRRQVADGDGPGPGHAPEAGPTSNDSRIGEIPAVRSRRSWWRGQLANWRLYLVRMISAGLSVLLAVVVVPGLSFVSWNWGQVLEISVIFALINAFVKPVLQFLSLRFLFSSYGVVIVVINTLLLMLLSRLLDDSIAASGIVALLVGGALIGGLGAAFDAVLGADYPVLDRDYRRKVGRG